MRALIIVSASRAMVMDPSRTCATNSFTRFLPRSRAGRFDAETAFFHDLIEQAFLLDFAGLRLRLARSADQPLDYSSFPFISPFSLSSLSVLPTAFEQQFLELVVALQAAAQIGQACAQIQQFL